MNTWTIQSSTIYNASSRHILISTYVPVYICFNLISIRFYFSTFDRSDIYRSPDSERERERLFLLSDVKLTVMWNSWHDDKASLSTALPTVRAGQNNWCDRSWAEDEQLNDSLEFELLSAALGPYLLHLDPTLLFLCFSSSLTWDYRKILSRMCSDIIVV